MFPLTFDPGRQRPSGDPQITVVKVPAITGEIPFRVAVTPLSLVAGGSVPPSFGFGSDNYRAWKALLKSLTSIHWTLRVAIL